MDFYWQITDKCNMLCAHCCGSHTMRGKHATSEVLRAGYEFIKKAVKDADSLDDRITIGGGEPTLHPQFWDVMLMAMSIFRVTGEDTGAPGVSVVTNGSVEESAVRLANMAENGFISAALSFDDFHEKHKISQKVREAFDTQHPPWTRRDKMAGVDFRDLRCGGEIIPIGRAKRTGVGSRHRKNDCICSCLFIKTSGNIHWCGCPKSPKIGDVWNGIEEIWEERRRLYDEESGEPFECYRQYDEFMEQRKEEAA